MVTSQSVLRVTLEKDQYEPGQEIVVNIDCDNTQCRKPVKKFKLKVFRNLLGLGYRGKYCRQSKCVVNMKFP